MDGRTKAYNDISLNLTYLTALFGKDCIIHLNITNLLGFENVFGYSYAGTPDESGTLPITGHCAHHRNPGHTIVYDFTLKTNIMKTKLFMIALALFSISLYPGQEDTYTSSHEKYPGANGPGC